MAPRVLVVALLLAFATACGGADVPPPVVVAVTPPSPPPPPSARASAEVQPAGTTAPAQEPRAAASIEQELLALDAKSGDRPTGLLDAAAAAGPGVGLDASAGGLHLGSGAGGAIKPGGPGGLADLGGPAPKGHVPYPAVTVGGATVSGGTVDNAEAVAAGMAAGFRRCFHKALKDDPTSITGGKVDVTAKLDANGGVVTATPAHVTGVPAKAVACVVARVMAAQFAQPSGPGATIVIPVTVVVQ